jgi:ribonuclease D
MAKRRKTTHRFMRYAISKTEINQLPLLQCSVAVHLIREDSELEAALAAVAENDLLGFDTETRPAFRKGQCYSPSLLQLAGCDAVYLFQLRRLTDLGPLFSLLEDERLLKAGISIRADQAALQGLRAFEPAGFCDIGRMARAKGFRNTGLRPLAALLLGQRISKGAQVTNWARDALTPRQIAYAATDAWVSRRLYQAVLDAPTNPEPDSRR